MALTFPNQSRSYDAVRDRIRFIGHDNVFEIVFFVEIKALVKTTNKIIRSELGYLAAFDAARGMFERVANKAYSRGRNSLIVLTEADVV